MLIKTALSQIQDVFIIFFSLSSHPGFRPFLPLFSSSGKVVCSLKQPLYAVKWKKKQETKWEREVNRWEEEARCRQGSLIPCSSGFEGSSTAGRNSGNASCLQHLHGNAFVLSLWSKDEFKSVARYAPKVSYKWNIWKKKRFWMSLWLISVGARNRGHSGERHF